MRKPKGEGAASSEDARPARRVGLRSAASLARADVHRLAVAARSANASSEATPSLSRHKGSIYYQLTPVISNDEIAPNHFILVIESPEISKVSQAGQFAMLKPNKNGSVLLGRPYSFFKREGSKLFFLYKVYGKGSRNLSRLKTGDELYVWGPLGRGFHPHTYSSREGEAGFGDHFPRHEVGSSLEVQAGIGVGVHSTRAAKWVFVAGGIGVAPFLFLAQQATKNIKMTLFFGIKTKDQAILEEDFKGLGCKVIFVTEDGSLGEKGLVTTCFERFLKKERADGKLEIFTCGPRPMEAKVARIVMENKIPCQMAFEEYMGCGLGTCMGCVVKCKRGEDWVYERVCREGPVFRADEIVWE